MSVKIVVNRGSAIVRIDESTALEISDLGTGVKVHATAVLPVNLRRAKIQSAATEAALRMLELMEGIEGME